MKLPAVLAGLVATASAIGITQPGQGSNWDFSQTNTIEWSSVSTDASSFKIILVNHATSPPSMETIKDSVNTADGKYAFSNFVAGPGDKYSIQFIGIGATNSGILTESQEFNVTKSGVAASTTVSPTSSPTGSEAAASTTSKNAGVSSRTFGAAGALAAIFAILL